MIMDYKLWCCIIALLLIWLFFYASKKVQIFTIALFALLGAILSMLSTNGEFVILVKNKLSTNEVKDAIDSITRPDNPLRTAKKTQSIPPLGANSIKNDHPSFRFVENLLRSATLYKNFGEKALLFFTYQAEDSGNPNNLWTTVRPIFYVPETPETQALYDSFMKDSMKMRQYGTLVANEIVFTQEIIQYYKRFIQTNAIFCTMIGVLLAFKLNHSNLRKN